MNQLPTSSNKGSIALISSREKEIIKLITFEYSTKEIARELYVSFETVKTHRSRIFKKLQVRNTAGLVRVAIQNKLIDLSAIAV